MAVVQNPGGNDLVKRGRDRRQAEAERRERERQEKWRRWEELHQARLRLAEERWKAEHGADGAAQGTEVAERSTAPVAPEAPVPAAEPRPGTPQPTVVPFELAGPLLDQERARLEQERLRLDQTRREAARAAAEATRAAADAQRAAVRASHNGDGPGARPGAHEGDEDEAAGGEPDAAGPGRRIYEGLNDVLDVAVRRSVLRRNPLRREFDEPGGR